MKNSIIYFFEYLGEHFWVLAIFLVILFTLIGRFFAILFFNYLEKKLSATSTEWDDIVLYAVRMPLNLLIWALGVLWAVEIVAAQGNIDILAQYIPGVQRFCIIAGIIWAGLRFFYQAEEVLISSDQYDFDQTTVHVVCKLLRFSTSITGILTLLHSLGISISGILAFGGIGGMAVGFAAKDLLANFFGAFIIYFDRPFGVGDWIISPDRELEGAVEKISWRVTHLRTYDKRLLYVPNSIFTNVIVQNVTRMSHRCINEIVGIRYDDMEKVSAITTEIKALLESHPLIDDTGQYLLVYLSNFGDFSVNLHVRAFSKETSLRNFATLKEEILLKINEIISNNGAEIAFPTQVISFQEKDMQYMLKSASTS